MNRDRNPLRYTPWIARDLFVWPLRLFLLAAVGVSLLVWRFASKMGSHPNTSFNGVPLGGTATLAQSVQMGVWSLCLTVAVLMTVAGIVGTDLERGYYRSWFSKPMSPLWYYLQRLMLGAVVILLCPLALGVGLAMATHGATGVTGVLLSQIALAYLLLAGATMLVSLFSSRGWLLVFVISILQHTLGAFSRGEVLPRWLLLLHRALPPFQLVQPAPVGLSGADLWHVVGYGTGMLVAALVILRVRPLGAGITT
jgi:hypothetical protein